MNSTTYFKVGKNNIEYVGSNFQENFMDIEFTIPKKCDLNVKKLERSMNDEEILTKFKPKESNLGELAYALKNDVCSKDGYANIFYIRNKDNVLWAVHACWSSVYRYWYVNANSVANPNLWDAGSQVISRDWDFEPVKYDTLKLELSEIMINGVTYKLVKK